MDCMAAMPLSTGNLRSAAMMNAEKRFLLRGQNQAAKKHQCEEQALHRLGNLRRLLKPVSSIKPAKRLRLVECSLPGSNQKDQFLGAGISFAHDIVWHQCTPLSAITHREVRTGL